MAAIETVTIVNKDHPDGKTTINKSDFDEKTMRVFKASSAPKKEKSDSKK